MNFFALQEKARRASRRMVILFALAVLVIVAAVNAVVVMVGFGRRMTETGVMLDYPRLALVSMGVLAIIGLASLFRTMSLRGGGASVARSMGATQVTPDTTNPAWRQLRNVIEEIAIAAGVPVPEIYIMENEAGINAFAAGYSPADAAVCVTQGCLDKLTRDELQGVIAHEFSHVLNGDMRLNIRLIGLLFGILVIGILGRLLMYSGGRVGSRRNSNGTYVAVIGLSLLAIGYIGFFFGRLIQASVARSRETLADASAVQFTRQSTGIAGALKKIAVLSESSTLQAQDTQQVAHMLFGEGIDGAAMFATHPPLMQRIKTLDPAFDKEELIGIAKAWQRPVKATDSESKQASLSGWAPAGGAVPGVPNLPGMPGVATAILAAGAMGLPSASARSGVTADGVAAQVATPGHDDFTLAGGLHKNIPDGLAAAARDGQQAPLLLLAMAVSRDDTSRKMQLTAAADLLDDDATEQVRGFADTLTDLHPLLRLPLAALAFPALRRLPRPKLQQLIDQLEKIIDADGKVELDEYCLAKLVQVQVIDALDPAAAFAQGRRRLSGCLDEMRDLFALVARYGNEDSDAARRAFMAACEEAVPGKRLSYAWPEDWQQALDVALARLDRISPPGKELVVRGLTRAIRDDGQVTVAESELLRVVCAALHCPLPPMLQAPSQNVADPAPEAQPV